MSAIVTDQFRILNATNFINSTQDSSNSYYIFVGLSNPTTSGFGRNSAWNTTPPDPTDNIDYINHYESTILFGKKITSANIRRVIRKIQWVQGTKYEMYRPDYSIYNQSGPLRLYDANYYVINSDYRVYICIDNGSSGINSTGNASQDNPSFTDLEPSKAGESGDGYIWKYLFTISPSDIVKFDSTEYITVPNDWQTSTDSQIVSIRENGNSTVNNNQIKKVYIQNAGNGYSLSSGQSCNLIGDGEGGVVRLEVTDTKITGVNVTSGGKNYTYALVDLGTTSTNDPGIGNRAELIPIIPPSKGHGFDIYKELGADKILVYARFDDSTKDFPIDAKFAQIGIIKNPTVFDSTGISTNIITSNEFSAVYAMRLSGTPTGTISVGDKIQQTVTGGKAVGYVASYDSDTKVLKYYKDRSLYYGGGGGSTNIDYVGISSLGKVLNFNSTNEVRSSTGNFIANIDSTFTGITTTISNKIINLGIQFTNGLANPEINNKSGDIIYIDNRPTVTRSSRQKEDIKIILEF